MNKEYKPRNCDENLLREIIKNCKNKTQVLKELGLRGGGNNYTVLNKWIKYFNIDISHFESASERAKNIVKFAGNKARPLEELLIEKSDYNSTNLKQRLYKEKLKERRCEICGQDENWKGTLISLILDHKNGDHRDNRIENLRIVCPNCNAGLPTHCSKNKFKKTKLEIIKEKQERKNKNLEKIKEKSLINNEDKIKLVKNSNINFQLHGWRIEVAKLIKSTPQYAGNFIKKFLPEIWEKSKKHKMPL